MNILGYAAVVAVWLGAGIYLFAQGHLFAGGFCILCASCISYSKKDDKDE